MGKIRLLSDEVASQVAAGEVVERPASIVKELVENSIDAVATRIDIEYQRGGLALIGVRDNGHGMDREDALLCLERHATSKIRTGGDLALIATFGFRGEALPSIASVSRFRLATREPGALAGTEVLVVGGKIETVRASGGAYGTVVEARSLFFNVPARRKFLRGERTEAAHIDHQFQALALSHPQLAFSLTRDGRQTRMLAVADSLGTRIRDLCGGEFYQSLFSIGRVEKAGVGMSGFLGMPGSGRSDRTGQFIFVNGRAVSSSVIWQPLRDAYGSALPRGMFPPAVLLVDLPLDHVDCNVHPSKREVRFRDSVRVREAIYQGVQEALGRIAKSSGPARVRVAPPAAVAPDSPGEPGTPSSQLGAQPDPRVSSCVVPAVDGPPPVLVQTPPAISLEPLRAQGSKAETLPLADSHAAERFRIVGAAGGKYIVLEDATGLVLLDNRAARERIFFESLLRRMAGSEATSQRLLIPAVVELLPRDFAWVAENMAILNAAGLMVDAFGTSSVRIEGVPPQLAGWPPGELLVRVLDDCRAGGRLAHRRAAEELLARSVCRHASLAGLPADEPATRHLIAELMRCDLPYACPNGKPAMIHFAFSELERRFGRTP